MTLPEQEFTREGIKALVNSATTFLGKLVNPPMEELGELLADQVRFFRYKNQVRILSKARELLEREKVDPQRVSLKILVPILEAGSIEENEDMINRWAALLATAANPGSSISVKPSFPEILKELSPKDALILDKIYEMVISIPIPREEWSRRGAVGISIKVACGLSDQEFEIAIDNLYRLRLCAPPSTSLEFIDNKQHRFQLQTKDLICLTDFGCVFVAACRKRV